MWQGEQLIPLSSQDNIFRCSLSGSSSSVVASTVHKFSCHIRYRDSLTLTMKGPAPDANATCQKKSYVVLIFNIMLVISYLYIYSATIDKMMIPELQAEQAKRDQNEHGQRTFAISICTTQHLFLSACDFFLDTTITLYTFDTTSFLVFTVYQYMQHLIQPFCTPTNRGQRWPHLPLGTQLNTHTL